MKKEEELFDLLYAFPKYRRLKNRLKAVNRDNRNKDKEERREWEEKATIKRLRKELKENATKKGCETSKWTS